LKKNTETWWASFSFPLVLFGFPPFLKSVVKNSSGLLVLVVLLAGPVLAAEEGALEVRVGQVLEKELAGETAGALAEYRLLLPGAPATNSALAGKILYRIGLCELRLGHPEEARQTWRKLVESCPPSDLQVARAREALRRLEQELDRIVMEGKISVQNADGLSLSNSTTQQLNNCILLAGEWGNEPAVLAGSNGMFRVERKIAGLLKDGSRYGYIFAEHPTQPLVGTSVIGPRSGVLSPPSLITLQPAIDLAGRVLDLKGEPVEGALIRVVGYWGGDPDGEQIPLPFDNILPPVFSGTNGAFLVKGLPRGVRYVLTADKPGWRSVGAGAQGSGVPSPESTIVLQSLGAPPPLPPESLTPIPAVLRWLRGDLENGGALSEEALKGHVVVYHFGSAYVENSLRSLYPREPGTLSQLLKLYGELGLVVIWVLPEDEGKGEAARIALELYPDLSVAVGGATPARGNLVVGRDGSVRPLCSDQALFKSVKQALGY
jgi:hypothetical protein